MSPHLRGARLATGACQSSVDASSLKPKRGDNIVVRTFLNVLGGLGEALRFSQRKVEPAVRKRFA